MVDAKARQDCIKEIDLLKVSINLASTVYAILVFWPQQLNHPNVIRYISSFVENNEVCPICEGLRGVVVGSNCMSISAAEYCPGAGRRRGPLQNDKG